MNGLAWSRASLRAPAFVLGGLVLAAVAAAQDPIARQVAAPPGDILSGIVRLPDPGDVPAVSPAIVLPLRFVRGEAGFAAEIALPVDRGGALALALLSPDAGSWRLLVAPPGSELRPIEEASGVVRRVAPAGDELPGWVVDRIDLRDAPPGAWTLRVEAPARRAPAESWLVARTAGELRLEARTTTLQTVAGEVIGIAARLHGHGAARVGRARAVITEGTRATELALQDDGLHEDGAAGDGLFGALVPEGTLGPVRARVEVEGGTGNGLPFLRTAQISFTVHERVLFLDGTTTATLLDAGRMRIAIGALPLASARRLHVSAEVWGRDAAGQTIPVCWLSRMLRPEEDGGAWALPLEMDLDWLGYSGAGAPLELREVRVQDPGTQVVLDRVPRVPLSAPALPPVPRVRAVTARMLTGNSDLTLPSATPAGPHAPIAPVLLNPALMLVHGYCSGGSVWPAAHFTQPKYEFLDPDQNRTHDGFAQLMIQKAQTAGLSSFGVVAHSQGGAAALHLLTYYTSGLDFAQGGRRIQSVATPYQGTPLASLGGFACGVNDNMTPAGSATWLAGIPSWARAEVWFWTTSNSGSVCNFLTSLFLADPEDGTVEQFRGDLPGGNSMGHVTGWCHTTGMSNPANYTDATRNAAMNAAAAR